MIVKDALRSATIHLADANIENAAGDARILLAFALNVDRTRLTLVMPDPMSADQSRRFDAAISARAKRQPVAQIVGGREFYGRRFKVTPDVLDPRPDTETLIDAALSHTFETVLDLGTGTGCILLTLLAERNGATGVGVDLSSEALRVATHNGVELGVDHRAAFYQSNWFDKIDGQFDLIVSNPPYISATEMEGLQQDVLRWEPHLALSSGGDGLDAYRVIAKSVRDYLNPDGKLVLEIGHEQAQSVSEIMIENELQVDSPIQDLNGKDRVLLVSIR